MIFNFVLGKKATEEVCESCQCRQEDGSCTMKRCFDTENPSYIRTKRFQECFSIINRGAFWYDQLSKEQKAELRVWYQAWLDAPSTKIIPEKPAWLK